MTKILAKARFAGRLRLLGLMHMVWAVAPGANSANAALGAPV